MINVLNLGAGVQSSCVLLMSCKGILPKIDFAVFADTGWEPKAVYEHLKWLTTEAAKHDIPVHIVSAGNLKEAALVSQVRGKKTDGVRWASLPLRVLNQDGSTGMIRRQCTKEYKIEPIRQFLRKEVLHLAPHKHAPREPVIDQWFGISKDEAGRSRTSDAKWLRFQYPLLNWPLKVLDRPWTRQDCKTWLKENYPERDVPRSACIGCPYHVNHEWRQMQVNSPEEFQEAVDFDKAVRNSGGMKGDVYVHRKCVPLDTIDFRSDIEHGQGLLWQDECDGMCGV